MKTWKKVLAAVLVCVCVFAVMQITVFAADSVHAADGVFSDSFLEFLIRLPVRIVHILFVIIQAPIAFIGSLFGR